MICIGRASILFFGFATLSGSYCVNQDQSPLKTDQLPFNDEEVTDDEPVEPYATTIPNAGVICEYPLRTYEMKSYFHILTLDTGLGLSFASADVASAVNAAKSCAATTVGGNCPCSRSPTGTISATSYPSTFFRTGLGYFTNPSTNLKLFPLPTRGGPPYCSGTPEPNYVVLDSANNYMGAVILDTKSNYLCCQGISTSGLITTTTCACDKRNIGGGIWTGTCPTSAC